MLNWSHTVKGLNHKFGNRDGAFYWTIFARIFDDIDFSDNKFNDNRKKSREISRVESATNGREEQDRGRVFPLGRAAGKRFLV